MTQLVGRRIIWEDEEAYTNRREPGDVRGRRSASLHLDPGRYILGVVFIGMTGSDHFIGVEVRSADGGMLLARSRILAVDIQSAGGRAGIFEVRPPSKNVDLA